MEISSRQGRRASRSAIPLGLVFSSTGSYGTASKEMLHGAPLAIREVKQAVYRCEFEAPQGPVQIDPDNNYSYLTPLLGRSVFGGQYEIVWTADQPVKPEPYLVDFDVRRFFEGLNRVERDADVSPRHYLRVIE